MAAQTRQPYNQGYMANGAPHQGPVPGAIPLLPNQGRVVQSGPIRLLCIADVRGNLRSLNELAKQARADFIIHTGDFGFYDESSLDRIAEKTLKHVAQYSPLIPEQTKKAIAQGGGASVKSRFPPSELPLSELPALLNKEITLDIPVYTVWGACEDVRVLEKFRSKEYKVNNLFIIDEAQSMLLEIGGVKLRLLGLGGAVVMHKLFDNGEGRTTIAGGQGTMWTTLLQMGELVDTANRVYDPTETRVFVTHASPAREGILNQLSVTLKADFSISAGLHFRYGSSYNEFSVNPTLDHYRGKLAASKASFSDVWETVKGEVEPAIQQNEAQQNLLRNALSVVEKMPTTAAGGNPFGGPSTGANTSLGQVDESAFKNMWNFNLADAAFGYLVLESDEQIRELFIEDDRAKIVKIDKWGAQFKVIVFKSTEDRDGAMERLPDDVKNRTHEDRSKPLIKVFQAQPPNARFQPRGGSSAWGPVTARETTGAVVAEVPEVDAAAIVVGVLEVPVAII
ncbi:hypothetical protein P8C59_008790 [Phyllachora maydis]|uniref:DUF2433 domain-containing protein n=1 Tax=Phyllachora maydis TaxID=1825666 RepID=A0AAD9MHD4_9PEZI|nr:hypothetical protein P8C59_008790 [Phyllachora maydis]